MSVATESVGAEAATAPPDASPPSLRAVRDSIDASRLRRSPGRTLAAFGFDLAGYLLCIAGIFFFDACWVKLGLGLGAGCFVAFLFIWAHDAAHGALFESRRAAEWLGTIAMLPSMNMYPLWSFGHNRVHHGFTSLSSVDWIWRPWSPEEYAAANRRQRLLYRLERSLPGCALHYLIRVWWQKMIRHNPGHTPVERRRMRSSKLLTLAFATLFSVLAYRHAGGLAGVLLAVVLPFLVFNYFIALFVYLHHTHPDIPFFIEHARWTPALGQLCCSTVVRMSRPMEALTHNIMIHVPHHVHPRIPFYHLPAAYQDLKRRYGSYIHEYRFRWATVRAIFRRCKLFDYRELRWHGFEAARLGGQPREAAMQQAA
jgi:omega-6 fatty acid desaturase (delta-12 desaturase)